MLNAFGVFAVFFPFLAVYGHEDNTLCGPIPEKASIVPFSAILGQSHHNRLHAHVVFVGGVFTGPKPEILSG